MQNIGYRCSKLWYIDILSIYHARKNNSKYDRTRAFSRRAQRNTEGKVGVYWNGGQGEKWAAEYPDLSEGRLVDSR